VLERKKQCLPRVAKDPWSASTSPPRRSSSSSSSRSGRGYRVEAYAAEPTPPNAINEKAIVDAEAVGEAIRRAHKRAGTKTREAAIAISGDAAITKVIQMPKNLSSGDLEGQVELQADQYIPVPDGGSQLRLRGHRR
jgi:type IV pilus assembly protein PilM